MSCHNPRMREYIGDGRDFHESQLPTNRSILQKFILEKDNLIHDKNLHFSNISTTDVSKPVASALERQWKTISPLFESPVIICGLSLVNKVSRLWDEAYNFSEIGQARGQNSSSFQHWINCSTFLVVLISSPCVRKIPQVFI